MTSDLEQQLRAALHEDAQRARLVNPDGPPEARPLASLDHRRRSLPRLVAAAAVVALLAVAAAVAQLDDDQRVDTVPPVTEAPVTEPTVTPTTLVTAPLVDAQTFSDILPGSTVALPPAPNSPRNAPAVVWTGRELIVWGGHDAAFETLGDGAAFVPATGTWRVIAPAPIEPRLYAATAWTGTEMVVWGGQTQDSNGAGLTDGAAYDPATDTWRRLPEIPFDSWEFGLAGVWAGDELVVVGGEADPQGGPVQMAAYDPATDEWRRIADAPPGYEYDPIWSGEAILTTVATTPGEMRGPGHLMRYDRTTDTWQAVEELVEADVSLIPVPDAGVVLALPHDDGDTLIVLDPSGTTIGTMPGIPADPATVGDLNASGGVAVGDEVLFWTRPRSSDEAAERWALNFATQTWRPLGVDEGPPLFGDLTWVPEAGVLIGWDGTDVDIGSAIVYRPPTPVGD